MKPHLHIALALIWRGGKVLVARRQSNADHLPDVWEFPGGKIESGESSEKAAIREAHEEVGLEIEILVPCERLEWEYPERRVTLHPFHCHIVGGEIVAREVAEIRFMTPADLRSENFPPANAALIEKLIQRHKWIVDEHR